MEVTGVSPDLRRYESRVETAAVLPTSGGGARGYGYRDVADSRASCADATGNGW